MLHPELTPFEYSTLDGAVRCRACGGSAKLDLLGRWLISCSIAMILSTVLLYGGVFFSGHLFLVSIFVIFGTWGLMSWVACPFLTLEAADENSTLEQKHSAMIAVVMLVAAIGFDSFLASRFEPEVVQEHARSAEPAGRER